MRAVIYVHFPTRFTVHEHSGTYRDRASGQSTKNKISLEANTNSIRISSYQNPIPRSGNPRPWFDPGVRRVSPQRLANLTEFERQSMEILVGGAWVDHSLDIYFKFLRFHTPEK